MEGIGLRTERAFPAVTVLMRHVTAGEHNGRFAVHFPATNTTIREESLDGAFHPGAFHLFSAREISAEDACEGGEFLLIPAEGAEDAFHDSPDIADGGGGVSLEDGGEEGGEGNRGLETFEKALERGTFAGLRETKRRQQLATAAEFGLERGRLTQRGDHGHALV